MNIRKLFLPFGTSSNKQIFYNVSIYIILLIIIIASILLPLIWHFMFKESNSSSEIVPNLQPILITKQPTLQPLTKQPTPQVTYFPEDYNYYDSYSITNNDYDSYSITNNDYIVIIIDLNKTNLFINLFKNLKIQIIFNNNTITNTVIRTDINSINFITYRCYFNKGNIDIIDKIIINIGNDELLTKTIITYSLSNMKLSILNVRNKNFTISVDQDSNNSWIATLKLL